MGTSWMNTSPVAGTRFTCVAPVKRLRGELPPAVESRPVCRKTHSMPVSCRKRVPQPPGESRQLAVVREDELGAAFDRGARERHRPHAAADAVASLEHLDLDLGAVQLIGGGEAGQPRPDYDDAANRPH